MKMTLNTNDIANALLADKCASWTSAGAFALAEYLEEYEESTGEEIEFDRVALRCDFPEYADLQDWAGSYWGTINGECQAAAHFGWDAETEDDEKDEMIREYIKDHGQLIEFDGGIIVSCF